MAIETVIHDKNTRDFLKGKIKKVEEITKNGQSYVNLLSIIVFKDIQNHFKNEEGPDGKWAPWSKMYQEHMEKIGRGSNNILQFSGHLRKAFVPTNYKTSSEGITWYNSARTKDGAPYAADHQYGTNRMPARSFMWLSDKGQEDIAKQTLAFLEDEKT